MNCTCYINDFCVANIFNIISKNSKDKINNYKNKIKKLLNKNFNYSILQ